MAPDVAGRQQEEAQEEAMNHYAEEMALITGDRTPKGDNPMTTILQMETADALARDGAAYANCRDARATIAQHPDYLQMVMTAWGFEARLDALLAETGGDPWPGLDKLRQLDRSVIRNNIKALTAAALERYDAEMRRPVWEGLEEAQKHARVLLEMLTAMEGLHNKAQQATGLRSKPPATKKLVDALTAILAQSL